ncbi:alcohol dehydrogenase catalytic domain-containing protein [Actinomadura sp. 1N219]|uniref:alcohol dehydrogenase catalytic domain-containing protein n=1 Tax=Actinomadura sp. 1N219 TaxID=3375152 RepID=UPI0037ABE87F
MKALVFTGPGTVELLDVDRPVAGEGEVLVRIEAAGICGSELHGILHTDFRKPPLIMGHELAGVTEDGRRVTVNPLLSCGACDRCRAGDDHLCRERAILGIHRPGGFAEAVAVPERALHVLEPGMDAEVAAMVEPLANAVHALRLADPAPGARIGVIGAGTIGLVTLLAARDISDRVEVCDLSERRLAVAARLGASRVGAELAGEFDVVIDAVGAHVTHRDSVRLLRPGGTAVWIGLLSAEPGFDGRHIVRQEKRVLGSYCYTGIDFAAALKLAGRVPLDWATSFSLADGPEIFTALMRGRQDVVKALLRP